MPTPLRDEIDQRLDELGLTLDGVDLATLPAGDLTAAVLVHESGVQHSVFAVFSEALTTSAVPQTAPSSPPLLLLGPRVNERSADALRRSGVSYLDASGNAFIRLPGVHIDVRGRTGGTKADHPDHAPPARDTNLFSSKRSQVIFALLTWPELREATVREIATHSRTSVGQAQETLSVLAQEGYAAGRKPPRHFERLEQLRAGWTAAYPTGLARTTAISAYAGDPRAWDPAGVSVVVSGESAVPDLLRPTTLTLYIDPDATAHLGRLITANRWRRDRQPTVFLRRQFWTAPAAEAEERTPAPRAPELLVYADLIASGDRRQLTAARELEAERAATR